MTRLKFFRPGLGFLLIPVFFLIFSPSGLPVPPADNPDIGLYRISWFRPLDPEVLSLFGEVIETRPDSVLIRTTRERAEALAEVGVELTLVLDPHPSVTPSFRARPLRKTGAEEPPIRNFIDRVDRDELYRLMGDLTGENEVLIGGVPRRILTRNSYQTDGITWATQYAYERFQELGLAVEYHEYSWIGNHWRNVVAEQLGEVYPEKIYIICAHIDSLPAGPISPGADDNASGTTTVLTAASILSGHPFEYTVRYVLFTGEEQGLIGSLYYVSDLVADGDQILGALNLDMIAYDSNGDGAMGVYSGTTEASNSLGDLFVDTIEVYGLQLDPTHHRTAPSWSDQYRFWQAGYSAMAAIESFDDFNPNYHTVNDTLSNCNLEYMTEIVRAAVGTLARLASPVPVSPAAARGDYAGDGTSDIAVFRPVVGLWAVRGLTRLYFGRDGDIPVPGDYRADGTTLPAVFRPASGLWAIRGLTRFYFGGWGDRPVPGPYSAAGWIPAVFREESGLWAVRGLTRLYFGRAGDLPVPADFSGRGFSDWGIYRPASQLWAVRGTTRFYFGSSGAIPLPGGYAGAGAVAAAYYRPIDGRWAIRSLSGFHFAATSDLPVPSDYLGEGVDRPAVFRPESGLWAVRGLTRAYFGAAGDIPVSR